MTNLVEIDSLEAVIIIDNEVDVLSGAAPKTVKQSGDLIDLALNASPLIHDRGGALKEFRMNDICCAAHGLSILLTASRGGVKHSILFDAGPDEDLWERNVARLAANVSSIEVVQLSHWHRDHTGGLLRAITMIRNAKERKGLLEQSLVVDVHPDRPDYRGLMLGKQPVSMQADPTIAEMKAAGATVEESTVPHTVIDDMFLISGEIPRVTPYETGLKYGVRYVESAKTWKMDEMIKDERFLMCKLKRKGLVVFTGCSHAGVINTTKHAVKLAGGSVPLHAVVGGYHLAASTQEQVRMTVSDLKKLNPKVLLPGHCSGWRVKHEIEKEMPGRLVPCVVGITYKF